DLQLIAPAEVTEGESVILTCKTTCSLTDPTFIWYKNTHDLTTNTFKSNELHLQRVSSEDAGSYNCAVRGSEHLPSPAQYLSVRYPPKNVYISLSGEIVEGSSVTLTCNSDANPPVETYTWFNRTTSVGKGKTFTISKVSSEDTEKYKCMCSNKVGHQNSTSVTLNVLYPPKNVFISSSGEKVEGISVTLTCSSDGNPPVENYTWFKENETSRVGSGQSYRALQSGLYYCEVQNKLGSERSAATHIHTHTHKYNHLILTIKGIVGTGGIRHVQRRDMGYISRRMLRMEPPGRRKRGKPRTRIMDVVREDMQVVGLTEAHKEERNSMETDEKRRRRRLRRIRRRNNWKIIRDTMATSGGKYRGRQGRKSPQKHKIKSLGNQWSVKYSKLHLCAVKGSTVVMEATYTHPSDTVNNRFWFINPVKGVEATDLICVPGYSGRVEYLGDEQNHFSLRLSDVKKSDEHMYYFKFITTKDKYQGKSGITLRVTDLQLIAPAEVTEGESVILTCKTTCGLTDPTFIWYKNTHDLTTNTFKSNELHLQRVSSEDAGNKTIIDLFIIYQPILDPPKNVSISSSGEKVERSSVTLTCSSDSNPPVETYTWFKENGSSRVGSGQSYRALQSGLYYCEVQNKLGSERSAAVSITII
ncbi:B-cell receptor CD22-like, partial [Silurus meridionalis]